MMISNNKTVWIDGKALLILISTCIVALLLRLAIIFWRQTYLLSYASTDIGGLAYNLAGGLGYTYQGFPSSYFGPGYTLIWAIFINAFDLDIGQLLVQIFQAAALSAAPIFIFHLARFYFDDLTALLSSLWFGFYPELLVLSSTMYSESLMMLLWMMALGLYAYQRRREQPSYWIAVLMGLVVGLLALTKGRMLFFALAIIGAALAHALVTQQPLRRALRSRLLWAPLLTGIAALVVLLPWIARNALVHQAFVPLESTMGFNLWLGHNPEATGTGKWRLGNSGVAGAEFDSIASGDAGFPLPPALQAELDDCDSELTCDNIYRRYALDFIATQPRQVASLALHKAAYAWWFDPTSATAAHPLYRWPWIITLLFAVVGAAYRLLVMRRVDGLLWLILLLSTVLQMVFFVVPRLRYPVYPVVFMLASYGVVLLVQRLRLRRRVGISRSVRSA
jgi:4-amino-4-deoxy-L-arabinose transferase-like glycosyltransferase